MEDTLTKLTGSYGPLAVAATVAFMTALAGGLATEIGPWYKNLRQPRWKPPDWAFGPAWTIIFTLIALAAARMWNAAPDDVKPLVAGSFLVNAGLNAMWSFFYFKWRRPDRAFVEVVFLWLSIAELVVLGWFVSKIAALMLAPYLAWVTFAACLNLATVRLNGPFGRTSTAQAPAR